MHPMDTVPVNDGTITTRSSSSAKLELPSVEPIERHGEFYVSDGGGMSIFLVENTLYKVHRYFLARESSVFQTMFGCPHPPAGQDGESDHKPIRLPSTSCSEFEALLDFFTTGCSLKNANNLLRKANYKQSFMIFSPFLSVMSSIE